MQTLRRWQKLKITFALNDLRQHDYIEYMQGFKLFHQPASKSKEPTSMELVPVDSKDEMESQTWYYKMIAFKAAGGDLDKYDELYKRTDWAETYEIYVLRSAIAHG